MGEVYRAWDGDLGRWVALKFIRGGDGGEDRARFEREARLAAQLAHPHIGAIYEIGLAGERPFIAMQLIEGKTLKAYARALAPEGRTRALVALIRDAARAVQAAHDRGIVHRDLKPENLMIGERDGRPHVYVMDFGLARHSRAASSLTGSGMIVGTPAYMPPEQARAEAVDGRADVYALGATLYDALAGRPPFDSTSTLDILHRVLFDDPPALDGVPGDLRTIVMKCLEKDPARRYASAGAFADDLARWLEGGPIEARPPTALERLRRVLHRKRTMAAAVAAAVVGITLVGALLVPAWRRARDEADAHRELGAIALEAVQAGQGLHVEANDPARVRQRLQAALARLDDFVRRHSARPQGHLVRARVLVTLNRLREAEEALRRCLEIDAAFAPAHSLLGRVLLEDAIRRDYGDPWTRDRRRQQQQGLLDRALHHLERGSSADPERWGLVRTDDDDSADALARALRLHYGGSAAEARRLLEEADRRQPSAELREWLGHWTKGSQARLDAYTRALQVTAHFARALVDRALERMERREFDAAIEDCDRALRVAPDFGLALLTRGLARKEKGDPGAAIADFDRLLELEPGHLPALVNRGLARGMLGDGAGAFDDYARAIASDPAHPIAYSNRGQLHYHRGDLDAAIADHTRAVELDPDLADAWLNRGVARRRKGDLAGALTDLERAAALEPDTVEILFNLGAVRTELGRVDEAISDFTRALTREPESARLFYSRGTARLHRARDHCDAGRLLEAADGLNEAVLDFTAAIKAEPAHSESRVNRAAAYLVGGDVLAKAGDGDGALTAWEHAVRDCAEAGRQRPGLAEAHALRGEAHGRRARLYRSAGHPEPFRAELKAAVLAFDEALAADPRCAAALVNRTNLLLAVGEWRGVIADAARLIDLRPGDPEPWSKKGDAHLALQEWRQAAEAYAAALKRAPAGWVLRGHVEKGLEEARQRAGP
jgi:tetratricopeptide (TPR) repeat protein